MKSVSALNILVLICGATIALTGCAGYQLGNRKPSAYAEINNIFVPSFKNDTLEPRLSSLVTNAIVKEIQADGTYKVTNRANCDAVLMGTVSDFNKVQLRAVRDNTLESRELQIQLFSDFYLADPNTGEKITRATTEREDGFVGAQSSNVDIQGARQGRVVGTTIQVVDDSFQVGERGALAVAADDLAARLVSQLANGW